MNEIYTLVLCWHAMFAPYYVAVTHCIGLFINLFQFRSIYFGIRLRWLNNESIFNRSFEFFFVYLSFELVQIFGSSAYILIFRRCFLVRNFTIVVKKFTILFNFPCLRI